MSENTSAETKPNNNHEIEIKEENTIKTEDVQPASKKEIKTKVEEIKEKHYFICELCELKEEYQYFGPNPPFYKKFLLLEDCYVIEDPFLPPKQGEILILGTHCKLCRKSVCKDVNCSIYFDGTYCIHCAKDNMNIFPSNLREKINRIIL